MSAFLSRVEHLAEVDSTQRVVTDWLLAGTPEVCIATADVQRSGRGRLGRTWDAPSGAALLASLGFRPRGLPAARLWQVAACVSLAMLDAAEETAGLRDGTLALKWPNDIVLEGPRGELRKVAGVLGEVISHRSGRRSGPLPATVERAIRGDPGAADEQPALCIGIGVNVDWEAALFPPDLAASMSSLREASGRPVDREALLEAFEDRLEPRYEALRAGRFDAGGWSSRQRTTGRRVEVEVAGERLAGMADGVDPVSGALILRPEGSTEVRAIDSGEVVRCRIVELPPLRRAGPSSGVPAPREPGPRTG